MSKYGEPLHIECGAKGPYIIGAVPRGRPNGEGLVELWLSGVGLEKLGIRSEDLAQRIVACVNALAGVPHPERLPELLAAMRSESDAMKRCDEGPSAFAEGTDERLYHVLRNRLLDATIVRVRSYRAMMGETT